MKNKIRSNKKSVTSIKDLEIGKRYCWCPFYDGEKVKNGLLSGVDINNGVAYLTCKDGTVWEIPFMKRNVVYNNFCSPDEYEYVFDENVLEKY